MTNLEKFLATALVTVGAAYTYTVIETVKHTKREMEYNAAIREGLEEMQKVLDQAKSEPEVEES